MCRPGGRRSTHHARILPPHRSVRSHESEPTDMPQDRPAPRDSTEGALSAPLRSAEWPDIEEPQEPDAATDDASPSRNGQSADQAPPIPVPAPRAGLASRVRGLHRIPAIRLILYYVVLIAVVGTLINLIPEVRRAFVAPVDIPALSEGAALLTGSALPSRSGAGALSLEHAAERALTTLLVILGALSLVVPVGWVYMFTKRLRYDPALVRSVIILPVVVAGITLVVKNSVALAFALAGIVAAVRFRNTLKDPRDAVYIFLTIGIGLSAGVQALDIALVMSFVFNFVVLSLWKFNFGSIYSGRYGRTGILSVGESELLIAQAPEQRREIRRRLLGQAERMKTDGILLVHSAQPDMARHTVQEALGEMAKDWRLAEIAHRSDGLSTLEYLLQLKKSSAPTELVGSLDDRWSSQVDAAEYIPFRTRKTKRK